MSFKPILIWCLLLLCLPHYAAAQKKYYRLTSLWTENQQHIQAHDMDGDGVDELVVKSQVQIDVRPQTGRRYYQSFRMEQFGDFEVTPITGASLDTAAFFVYYKTEEAAAVDYLVHSEAIGRQIEPAFRFARLDTANKNYYDQGIAYISDFVSSGKKLALFRLNSTYGRKCVRGVLAYDLAQKKEIWRFTCGPQLRTYDILDTDGDGSDEIFLGAYAPENGVDINGTSDDSSYVFALDDNGEILWRKTVGGGCTGAFCFDGNMARFGRRLCVFKSDFSDAAGEKLSLLDLKNGKESVPPFRSNGNFALCPNDFSYPSLCADLDNDGDDEIVFGNNDGFIRILDENLALKEISRPYRKDVRIDAVADLNGDGPKEIVCHLQQERLVVFDASLRAIASFPLELQLTHYVYPVKNGNFIRLLLQSWNESNGLSTWRLLELEESQIPFETYSGGAKYFWWLLGLVGLGSFVFIAVKSRKSLLGRLYVELLKYTNSFENSLLVRKNGRIQSAGKQWLDLSSRKRRNITGAYVGEKGIMPVSIQKQLLKKLTTKDQESAKLSIEKNGVSVPVALDIDLLPFLNLCRISLRYINEENFIRNIKHWSGVAQKLAHGIKNPLTAIKLNTDELGYHLKEAQLTDDEVFEHIASISSQVDKLRRMADGFMRFIEFEEPNLARTDINQFIEQMVAQERDNIPEDVRLVIEPAKILPFTLIDQQQLQFAFVNVLYNAVQSLDGHGTVHISTDFVQHLDANLGTPQDFIEIRVQDNGCGIPADVLQKVTLPYYTTKKEGTGLGLSIVVKIIEMHEGQFDINSQEGLGTTFTFRLKPAA